MMNDPDEVTTLQEDPTLSVTTSAYPEFEAAVTARVLFHLADVVEDQEYLQEFSKSVSQRIDFMLQKYRDGQLEHGGDIRDRDIKRDRTQEILDLFIYDLVEQTLQGLKAEIKL